MTCGSVTPGMRRHGDALCFAPIMARGPPSPRRGYLIISIISYIYFDHRRILYIYIYIMAHAARPWPLRRATDLGP